MMNALLALDEMRASTNFNMNMAAITPFVLLMYLTKRAFQFVFYATLKLGKSREETYGSFLHILTGDYYLFKKLLIHCHYSKLGLLTFCNPFIKKKRD